MENSAGSPFSLLPTTIPTIVGQLRAIPPQNPATPGSPRPVHSKPTGKIEKPQVPDSTFRPTADLKVTVASYESQVPRQDTYCVFPKYPVPGSHFLGDSLPITGRSKHSRLSKRCVASSTAAGFTPDLRLRIELDKALSDHEPNWSMFAQAYKHWAVETDNILSEPNYIVQSLIHSLAAEVWQTRHLATEAKGRYNGRFWTAHIKVQNLKETLQQAVANKAQLAVQEHHVNSAVGLFIAKATKGKCEGYPPSTLSIERVYFGIKVWSLNGCLCENHIVIHVEDSPAVTYQDFKTNHEYILACRNVTNLEENLAAKKRILYAVEHFEGQQASWASDVEKKLVRCLKRLGKMGIVEDALYTTAFAGGNKLFPCL